MTPDLQTDRLLKLADHIETLEHFPYSTTLGIAGHPEPGGFNLGRYYYDCGTPACLAAHAKALFAPPPEAEDLTFFAAAFALGLTEVQAEALFAPVDVDCRKVSPAIAARVLRRLATTGETISYRAAIAEATGEETP